MTRDEETMLRTRLVPCWLTQVLIPFNKCLASKLSPQDLLPVILTMPSLIPHLLWGSGGVTSLLLHSIFPSYVQLHSRQISTSRVS